jgi:predicted transcriptional regulator
MIDVQYKTDDPKRREIVERYFATDERGRFLEDVSEIASDHGMTWKQILSIVRSCSTALSTVHRCEICGRQKEFTSRQDIRENRTMGAYLCSRKCREKYRREEQDRRAVEEETPEPTEKHSERLLRQVAGQVTEALSNVKNELDTISDKLQKIESSLRHEHGIEKETGGEPL